MQLNAICKCACLGHIGEIPHQRAPQQPDQASGAAHHARWINSRWHRVLGVNQPPIRTFGWRVAQTHVVEVFAPSIHQLHHVIPAVVRRDVQSNRGSSDPDPSVVIQQIARGCDDISVFVCPGSVTAVEHPEGAATECRCGFWIALHLAGSKDFEQGVAPQH